VLLSVGRELLFGSDEAIHRQLRIVLASTSGSSMFLKVLFCPAEELRGNTVPGSNLRLPRCSLSGRGMSTVMAGHH
jgi:hypothetical protein